MLTGTAIVLYLFSTSNHNLSGLHHFYFAIVLYLFSTSNHNLSGLHHFYFAIVLYLFSTSNHNMGTKISPEAALSYISFLHQTTTFVSMKNDVFYCLISLFYIKPQPLGAPPPQCPIVLYLFSTSNHNVILITNGLKAIVLYLFSTSNHNIRKRIETINELSYISFLHQTTTYILQSINLQ